MRTTIDIQDHILHEVLGKTGMKSKKKAVETALKEYLQLSRRQELAAMITEFKDFDLTLDDLDKLRNDS